MPDDGQSANGQSADGQFVPVELLGDADRAGAWMLMAGGIPQSYVDLDDPRYLELEYMRRLGHLLDLAAPAGAPLRVLHLGGGGLTLARYVAATRPGSRQVAVEADAEVVALVRRRLPLDQRGPGARRVEVRVADARAVLEQVPAGTFDLVVADVFVAARTPAHLTTVEFTRAAARALAPGGIFAVNIGDGPGLAHARRRMATVRAVLDHGCMIAETAVLRHRSFGNLVVAASRRELPAAELARRAAADPYPAQVLEGAALEELAAGAELITDADAGPSPAPPPGAYAG
jgi:spermidine synthase